jgi:transcription elongation factor Elf1
MNQLTTDLDYIHSISHKLRNFKKKKDYLYNFSCPVCGDSSKKKTKARGYFFRVKDMMLYRCHNCGLSTTFGKLLERIDAESYKRYIMARYSNGETKHTMHDTVEYTSVKMKQTTLLDTVKTVSRLSPEHPVRDYLNKRMIPEEQWDELRLVNKFCTFVNRVVPGTFQNIKEDHPRLIIPFYDKTGKCVGFQGRAFGKETPKYLTIMLDVDAPKLYGLDKVNFTEKVYVLEGPIDSMFIDNSIAMAGADASGLDKLSSTNDYVFVYDNEPRSPEIVKRMKRHIDNNDAIVIWPEKIGEKDINDMIMSGISKSEIMNIISNNTHRNLSAKMRFTEWKKCE